MKTFEQNPKYYPEPSWLEPEKNPFGLACMDIRSLTRAMQSITDEQTRHRFRELQTSSGEEYVRLCHSWGGSDSWFDAHLKYPAIPELFYGPLFNAEQLEDKWNIYLLEGIPDEESSLESLYFCRSWTGDALFRALLEYDDQNSWIFGIQINPKIAAGVGPERANAIIDFIMKSHIFELEAPAPLPYSVFTGGKAITVDMEEYDLLAPPSQIAQIAFKGYGWRAGYVTPNNPPDFPFDFEHAEKLR